jgi:pSer/pThr/pTyr-binding forkhead associated (FHA) protein
MDPSEIGCFGTLRLMKRLEPNTPVASFPIDDDTVTFGRDPTCSVRLYYPSVSTLHAKIIFQERKVRLKRHSRNKIYTDFIRVHIQAFVIVLGSSGLHIDGCHVLPSTNPAMPTTIPVSNNSEIEIHKKRFVFTYPPKELRPALYMSPSKDVSMTPGTRRKTLRMSMIQSAEVFTPRPSKNPRENLRILQSPLKQRSQSPLKQQYAPEEDDINEDENEDEIVLVDGNYPHVVEEEKDLVILESVEVEVPQPQPPQTPARAGAFARIVPGSGTNQYQTPRRRPQARPSLHRAVLIRSAQRAVIKQEIEREEEGEEKEVEDFIAEEPEGQEYDNDDNDHGEEAEEEVEGESTQPTDQGSRWRKSIEVVKGFGWPFRGSSTTPEEVEDQETEDQSEGETDEVRFISCCPAHVAHSLSG